MATNPSALRRISSRTAAIISATDKASDLNGPQRKMELGCQRLGWHFCPVVRNVDLYRYSPEAAGYTGFGDPSGAKQSTAAYCTKKRYEFQSVSSRRLTSSAGP